MEQKKPVKDRLLKECIRFYRENPLDLVALMVSVTALAVAIWK